MPTAIDGRQILNAIKQVVSVLPHSVLLLFLPSRVRCYFGMNVKLHLKWNGA